MMIVHLYNKIENEKIVIIDVIKYCEDIINFYTTPCFFFTIKTFTYNISVKLLIYTAQKHKLSK